MKRKILNVMLECYVDTNLIDFLLDKQYKTDISELTQIFNSNAHEANRVSGKVWTFLTILHCLRA